MHRMCAETYASEYIFKFAKIGWHVSTHVSVSGVDEAFIGTTSNLRIGSMK